MEGKIVYQHSQRGEVFKNSNQESYKTAPFCKRSSENISPSAPVNCNMAGCICQYINVTIKHLGETGCLQNRGVRGTNTGSWKAIQWQMPAFSQGSSSTEQSELQFRAVGSIQRALT